VGSPLTIPEGSATDNVDSYVICTYTVVDPDGTTVSVINGTFTPEKVGTYIVRYSASDNSGNAAEDKIFRITVTEGEKTTSSETSGGCGSVGSLSGMCATLVLLLGAGICTKKKSIKK
jgi:hypothetical protein